MSPQVAHNPASELRSPDISESQLDSDLSSNDGMSPARSEQPQPRASSDMEMRSADSRSLSQVIESEVEWRSNRAISEKLSIHQTRGSANKALSALVAFDPESANEAAVSETENAVVSTTAVRLDLPDEVLVSVLRFVQCAASLWRLRGVCRRWRRVIDSHDAVWRSASFRGAQFARPVRLARSTGPPDGKVAHRTALALGTRSGRAAVLKAAGAGNEWARFLRSVLFRGCPLYAVTVAQPVASALVRSARRFETRETPPWQRNGNNIADGGAWVAVHAARRVAAGLSPAQMAALPRGAVVGLVHVCGATACGSDAAPLWAWHIDRNVSLRKPLRCAGYVGVWTLSAHLTEFFVRALHMQ